MHVHVLLAVTYAFPRLTHHVLLTVTYAYLRPTHYVLLALTDACPRPTHHVLVFFTHPCPRLTHHVLLAYQPYMPTSNTPRLVNRHPCNWMKTSNYSGLHVFLRTKYLKNLFISFLFFFIYFLKSSLQSQSEGKSSHFSLNVFDET